ncbi:MAG: ParA family protein, partial [Thermoanaerobaculia bacterium]
MGDTPFTGLVTREIRPGLDLMVAGARLLEAEEKLREKPRDKRRTRLARRLAEIEAESYEVVILDCPPSQTLLLENAYEAADEVVLPAKLDPLSIPALDRTRLLVKSSNAARERPLKIDGILPTFYDLRTHVSSDVLEALRERFTKILSPIRINAALAEAPSRGQTIFDFDGSARGAVDYALLAEDLRLD